MGCTGSKETFIPHVKDVKYDPDDWPLDEILYYISVNDKNKTKIKLNDD